MYDIIIIGAGPAGLTAALYALRFDKKVMIIEKGSFGGQITFSPKVENYPGIKQMSGSELADKLLDQVLTMGAEIELDEVKDIKVSGAEKIVITKDGEYRCKSIIIAVGARHRMLGVEGEDELVGNGISFCAVCDGAFYKGKTVAVAGGGNSALQEAMMLSEICDSVYIIQNLSYCTGEARLCEGLSKKTNVQFIMDAVITGFTSDNGLLTGVTYKVEGIAETKTLKVDGLFVAIGLAPQNDAFAEISNLDKDGYFDADESCRTKVPGIFVAGDCRSKQIRQITTAAADGTVSALAACRYLDSLK